jgi:bifunctional UDP-N-acetylglucosamine pyrophosphorylase/glucosamine-1-phosphate N-acetyltransferase
LESTIGNNVKVGPFAYIRPDCRIGNNIRIGDFVELKKAVIGDGTKVSHLTYVGDAEVGRNVNFGCGTVTANFDGVNKHLTVIEDGAFIGCNTNLIAPVRVGKNATTAAGTTVTQDVPEGSLAIGRVRQTNKPDWNKRKK